MSIHALMNATCEILRLDPDVGVDEYNVAATQSYLPHLSVVRCRFAPRLSNIRGLGGFVGENWRSQGFEDIIVQVALILLPAGTDVNEHDRITDIRNSKGVMLETGPMDLLLVRTTFTGRSRHHVSLVAKRIR